AQPDQSGPARAVDILAERLPGVPSKPANPEKVPAEKGPAGAVAAPGAISHAPATTGPDARPTPPPPQASIGVASRNTAAAASSEGAGSPSGAPASTADAVKVSTKPVKTAAAPKPQPAIGDRPH
ncbi:MAG: hypothetical protein WB566_02485, partial [Terriglobales bacterium]